MTEHGYNKFHSKNMIGEITLITGPMFAGKTSELLRQLKVHQDAERTCVLIKHSSDRRYSVNSEVVTHDGITAQAIECSTLNGMTKEEYMLCLRSHVIGIDEGQFFDDLADFCDKMADHFKSVIVAGLCNTHDRKGFKPVMELFPSCENILRLRAVCIKCSNPADFTFRDANSKSTTLVGGEGEYRALCRNCHIFETNRATNQ